MIREIRWGGNVSTPEDDGRTHDKAAEKINADVLGRTLEKGLKVKEENGEARQQRAKNAREEQGRKERKALDDESDE